jgi:RNA polymerase sigma-70 factor (ECF subfamily)
MLDRASAFYEVIWPHAAALLRTAQVLCRNHADAEDLVQETLLKAHRSLQQFNEGTDARRWLMTILRNTRIDRIRSQAARGDEVSLETVADAVSPQTSEELPPEAWNDIERLLERMSDQQMIDLLKELPEEMRWSLLLVDVEGLELSDAAAVMSVPVGTVKSRLHRGRAILRSKLRPVAPGSKLRGEP